MNKPTTNSGACQSRKLAAGHVGSVAIAEEADPAEASPDHVVGTPALERAIRLQTMMDGRKRHFGGASSMFGDPGFEILLLVYIKSLERKRLSISAASTAGETRTTTGLRWIGALERRGLIVRSHDDGDRRRSFLSPTAAGRRMMDDYLQALPF